MSGPALTRLGGRLREQLAPLAPADEAHGHAATFLVAAVARTGDQLDAIAHDGEVPWATLMDATVAPDWALDWLGQFAGVRLPPSLSSEARRTRVLETDGRRRGTLAALIGAARQSLTGTQHVEVIEREGGDAYALRVITYADETPNPAQTLADLLQQKPAGLVLIHEVRTGQTWDQAESRSTTWNDARVMYATWNDARDYLPT
jgi:hypothetical protein